MRYDKEVVKSQRKLKIISINNEQLTVKARYGPSKPTQIYLRLSEELAFLVAAIIGDGHMKRSKFQITIECSNRSLVEYIREICQKEFKRDFNMLPVILRKGKKQTFALRIDSKAIYDLLHLVFEIPLGKKSHIVKIPSQILNSNRSVKAAFLIGIMMTEGGSRRRKIGLSTASKKLWGDLINLFKDLNIKILKDRWTNKKYNKEYYGITFKGENLKILMRECRSGQTGQILIDHFKDYL